MAESDADERICNRLDEICNLLSRTNELLVMLVDAAQSQQEGSKPE